MIDAQSDAETVGSLVADVDSVASRLSPRAPIEVASVPELEVEVVVEPPKAT